MQIHFKGTQYELSSDATARMTRKVTALKKYMGKDSDNAHAYVELGKETTAHQSGDVWRSEINLTFPGSQFRAVAVKDTLETAIDESVNELAKELRRSKKRGETLVRQGGSVLKGLMRGFRS